MGPRGRVIGGGPWEVATLGFETLGDGAHAILEVGKPWPNVIKLLRL